MADPEIYDIVDGKGLPQTFTPNPDPVKGAKQDAGNDLLASILAKLIATPATEAGQAAIAGQIDGLATALASILAKLIAAPATAANQSTIIGHVDGIEAALTALNAKDFSTQTTLAAVLAKMIAAPATEAKQDAETAAVNRIGTRSYGAAARVAVAATTAYSAVITATEVLVHASVKQYIAVVSATGTPTVDPAAAIPLEAGEKFHLRITSGLRIATVRDTADGFLHIAPVV